MSIQQHILNQVERMFGAVLPVAWSRPTVLVGVNGEAAASAARMYPSRLRIKAAFTDISGKQICLKNHVFLGKPQAQA